jgi:hypothetical protein
MPTRPEKPRGAAPAAEPESRKASGRTDLEPPAEETDDNPTSRTDAEEERVREEAAAHDPA